MKLTNAALLICILSITPKLRAQQSKQKDVDSLFSVIGISSIVTSMHIGKAGKFSASYQTFLHLVIYATNEELMAYSNDSSAAVRVYAYYGLKYKKSPQRKEVKSRLLSDNNSVNYMRGCLKGKSQVYKLIRGKGSLYHRSEIRSGIKRLNN